MTGRILDALCRSCGAVCAAVSAEEAAEYLLPGKTTPDGNTVIVAAVPYFAGIRPGTVSLYARGRDYHRVLRELFSDAVRSSGGDVNAVKFFADVSPFREVSLCSAAGLGRVGENGLLLTEPYGSFVFLGEICGDFDGTVTPLRTPVPCDRCGACRASCPTGGRGCLSEITQRRGELTEAERLLMRRYHTAWGCDVCQIVCPANKNAQKTKLPAFCGEFVDDFDWGAIRDLSNGAVERMYADRAFVWRGGGVIKRNAGILSDEGSEPPDRS